MRIASRTTWDIFNRQSEFLWIGTRQEPRHTLPHKDCGPKNDPAPYRKPVDAAQDWSNNPDIVIVTPDRTKAAVV